MAAEGASEEKTKIPESGGGGAWGVHCDDEAMSSYLGVSFAVFLALLPRSSVSYVASLQSRNRILSVKLFQAEDQLKQIRSRQHEDSKANARVVEIFSGHRHAWQREERRLRAIIDDSEEEIAAMRARLEEMQRSEAELRAVADELRRDLRERDQMLDYIASVRTDDDCEHLTEKAEVSGDHGAEFGVGVRDLGQPIPFSEACSFERTGGFDELALLYRKQHDRLRGDFLDSPVSKECTGRSRGRQDSNGYDQNNHEPLGPIYHMKNFVPRRVFPWKVDGESAGVSSKLQLLEQELINLEKLGKGDLSRIPALMRKQAKRYQSLIGKIDDLCRRMQLSDPCEPTLSPEFRTQRQTEFLLEALRLQNRASETRQKLGSLEGEAAAAKSGLGDELTGKAEISTRRSLDSIRNNLKEIQRNVEIWLARITGDLEGILATDGVSHAREY